MLKTQKKIAIGNHLHIALPKQLLEIYQPWNFILELHIIYLAIKPNWSYKWAIRLIFLLPKTLIETYIGMDIWFYYFIQSVISRLWN